MLQLHYYPGVASMTPHILLQEMGASFELVRVDRLANAHKSPAYLKLNPNGLIPVLTDGELVLYETAAILLYLCDKYPDARLAPTVGTTERAHFYKWLAWLTNTLQTTLIVYFFPERWVNEGNAAAAAEVKAQAQHKVGAMLDLLDAEMAHHGGPWLLGEHYSALDPFAMMLCRWTRGFTSAPARSRPHLGPYLQRVLERPGVQRALAAEQLAPPWV